MEISSEDLSTIRELYTKTLYLQAYQVAKKYPDLNSWSTSSARLLGGRLAIQIGAPKLGRYLHLKAYRETPYHYESIYYYARYRLERLGPWETWKFMLKYPDWQLAPAEVRADWYGFQGFVAARLRDFDRAERYLNRADALTPDRPWLAIERSAYLEFCERFQEALECTDYALKLQPDFRPAIQSKAHLLQLMGRDREALEHLLELVPNLESGILQAHLASVQLDLGFHEDARKSYDRYFEMSPLMEKDVKKWIVGKQIDTAYFCLDLKAAQELSAPSEEEFYQKFNVSLTEELNKYAQTGSLPSIETLRENRYCIRLDRMEKGECLKQIVDESRTLELIRSYWDVETIEPPPFEMGTFDGLPEYQDRLWAERNHFYAKEFQVTLEAAYTLLEQGLPFLLTMVEVGYTHSQMVVGCDKIRCSIWLRELSEYRASEVPFLTIQERYGNVGPRALVIVPEHMKSKLESLDLPESQLFNQLFEIQSSLFRHDRSTAVAVLEKLQETNPNHRITLQGRLAIARYDANPYAILKNLESLLQLYPNDATLLLSKISIYRDLGRRDQRLKVVKEQVQRAATVDPLFTQHYAQLLGAEPTKQPEAIDLLEQAIKRRPFAAGSYFILAGLYWEQEQFSTAIELYRFASSLEDRDDNFAEAFYRASSMRDQQAEATHYLQARHNRLCGKVASPTRSLFIALSEQEDMESAFQILEDGYSQLITGEFQKNLNVPKIGKARIELLEKLDLLLFAAEMKTCYNDPAKGQELLNDAKKIADAYTVYEPEQMLVSLAWYRSAARIALIRADLKTAKEFWEYRLQKECLANDAMHNLTRALGDLEGRQSALDWLRETYKRFPNYYPLQQLWNDLSRTDQQSNLPDTEVLQDIVHQRQIVQQCPEDASAHRDLALQLLNTNRYEEAIAELEIAQEIEPDHPSYFYTLGTIYQRMDRIGDANKIYQRALEVSLEHDIAITELVNLARGEEDKEEVLHNIAAEFDRQSVFGDSLLTFRDQAVVILDPEELLKYLQDWNTRHPGIWQTWSALTQQLLHLREIEKANELIHDALQRFPMQPRLWYDQAMICRHMGDIEGQIHAFRNAIQIAPNWSYVARELAETLDANNQSEDARVVLEQTVARSPLDPVNHGFLAEHLWNHGETDEAIERITQSLRLDPGADWAWRMLNEWTDRSEQPERAVEIAREITRTRPGDSRGWLALVRYLYQPIHISEALKCLEKAIELNPRQIEAYDLLAEKWCQLGRFDEARKATKPAIFADDPPLILEGRSAWVEAQAGNYKEAIDQMRALLIIEPANYYWGWQQLAEWYNDVGDHEKYLEIAQKLVEMRPDNPLAIMTRGDANLQLGNRQEAKSDFREAQKLAPIYTSAGLTLFDICLADGEYDEARRSLALLQEHMNPAGQPLISSRYAQLAAALRNQKEALEYLHEVCTLPFESPMPLNSAVFALRNAGWSKQVDRVLRDSWKNKEGFQPMTLLHWLEGTEVQKATFEEKLDAINEVLRVYPQFIQGLDCKAELLAREGKLDEAFAICSEADWKLKTGQSELPLLLQARVSWLHAVSGNKEAAIQKMRAIVTHEPNYYYGWQHLSNWYDSPETYHEQLEATEHLVRLAPQEPSSYIYRGRAKQLFGDHRGAKADFQKALEIDPTQLFAGIYLFDEHISTNDDVAAARTLAQLQEHADGPLLLTRQIILGLRRKDIEMVRRGYDSLTLDRELNYQMILDMTQKIEKSEFSEIIDPILEVNVDDMNASPALGRLWVERCSNGNRLNFLARLPEFEDAGPIFDAILLASIQALATPERKTALIALTQNYKSKFQENDYTWFAVGAAYLSIDAPELTLEWMSDWKNRSIQEGFYFRPLVLALRLLEKDSECVKVCEHALQLQNQDDSFSLFHVLLAFESALEQKTDAAYQHLNKINQNHLYFNATKLLFILAESLIKLQTLPSLEKKKQLVELRKPILAFFEQLERSQLSNDLKRSFNRWLEAFTRQSGSIAQWWWKIKHNWKPIWDNPIKKPESTPNNDKTEPINASKDVNKDSSKDVTTNAKPATDLEATNNQKSADNSENKNAL